MVQKEITTKTPSIPALMDLVGGFVPRLRVGLYEARAGFKKERLGSVWMTCDMDSTAPEWVIEYPETEQVFRKLGIDISCGGKSLFYLCTHEGLDPDAVLAKLQAVVEKGSRHEEDGE